MPAKLSDTAPAIRLFIKIPADEHAEFKAKCEAANKGMSEVVRELIGKWGKR